MLRREADNYRRWNSKWSRSRGVRLEIGGGNWMRSERQTHGIRSDLMSATAERWWFLANNSSNGAVNGRQNSPAMEVLVISDWGTAVRWRWLLLVAKSLQCTGLDDGLKCRHFQDVALLVSIVVHLYLGLEWQVGWRVTVVEIGHRNGRSRDCCHCGRKYIAGIFDIHRKAIVRVVGIAGPFAVVVDK